MNLKKLVAGILIMMAMTLNFGLFLGGMDTFFYHEGYQLFGALLLSVIATFLKLGDTSPFGSVFLATSLVADVHLSAAVILWVTMVITPPLVQETGLVATVVSLSAGALAANVVSVMMLVLEVFKNKH